MEGGRRRWWCKGRGERRGRESGVAECVCVWGGVGGGSRRGGGVGGVEGVEEWGGVRGEEWGEEEWGE